MNKLDYDARKAECERLADIRMAKYGRIVHASFDEMIEYEAEIKEKLATPWIKMARDTIGANNVELANYVGVSKAAIEKYISGENIPGLEVTLKLCKFFGLSMDEMFNLK